LNGLGDFSFPARWDVCLADELDAIHGEQSLREDFSQGPAGNYVNNKLCWTLAGIFPRTRIIPWTAK